MAEEIVEVDIVDEKEVIGSPKTPNKDTTTAQAFLPPPLNRVNRHSPWLYQILQGLTNKSDGIKLLSEDHKLMPSIS